MTNSIFEKQNSEENLKLLVAQRGLYSVVKTLNTWRIGISLFLAIMLPLVLFFLPQFASIFKVMAGVWLLIFLILKRVESKRIEQAATVQEEFDVNIFNLDWNKILVGDKITREIINDYNDNFVGDRTLLLDWYPNTKEVPKPLDVLLCQRANLVWDSTLRGKFLLFIVLLNIAILAFGILVGLVLEFSLLEYIVSIFFYSLPAYIQAGTLAKNHFEIIKKKYALKSKLLQFWEDGVDDLRKISIRNCREIQNIIFTLRKKQVMIPDIWYSRYRDKYQINMEKSTDDFVMEFKKKNK